MRGAVQLDDQLGLFTDEVGEIAADRDLPPELEPAQSVRPDQAPQRLLGQGLGLAETAGVGGGVHAGEDDLSPWARSTEGIGISRFPDPSPRGRGWPRGDPSPGGRGRGPPRSGGRERDYEDRRPAGAPSRGLPPLPGPLPMGEGVARLFPLPWGEGGREAVGRGVSPCPDRPCLVLPTREGSHPYISRRDDRPIPRNAYIRPGRADN